ncbi:MAG: ThiF family adenylyltransferase [Desulfobacula sp.]|nr:ThiF family adenylyltransferase [Desulfobacula sp.]
MKLSAMFKILTNFGISNKVEYINQAFSRNIGLLTIEEQQKISDVRVAIPGMGGVGGVHLITLARTGICKFNIADFDHFEAANINRQYGARVQNLGKPKLDVMKEDAFSINPFIEFSMFSEGINESNIDKFLEDVDVVVDGLDFFKFDIRRLLFKKAAEKGIYVITAGPMGFSSALLVFSPNGMGFDEYFNIKEGMTDEDKYLSFAIGLAPKPTHIKYMDLKKVDLQSKAGPSLNSACQICAGFAATEVLKIVLKRGKLRPVPSYLQYDPYLSKLCKGYLIMGNKNPIQAVKMKIIKIILKKNKSVYKTQRPVKPNVNFKAGDMISKSVLEYLITAGIQAPSGDNAQPWKFEILTNQIDLYLVHDKDLSFFNVNQIASQISCGAVVENIVIAASSLGIGSTIEDVFSKNGNLVISVKFSCKGIEKDNLSDYIWKRHTNRKLYERRSILSATLSKVLASTKTIQGAKLHVVTDKNDLKKIANIIYQIDQIRNEHRPLHEHLMSMIRFTDEEALEYRDGLPLKNLEAGLIGELFLKMTKQWTVMNIINKIGIGKMVARHSYQGITHSSGVALLTIDGSEVQDMINGGRALERVWLTLASLGLAMQPMTAITLFYQRVALNRERDFQLKHQKILNKIEKNYKELFHLVGKEPNRNQIMLFRFGHSDKIHCRTLRQDHTTLIREDIKK